MIHVVDEDESRWPQDEWMSDGNEHTLPRVPPDIPISGKLTTSRLAFCQGILMVSTAELTFWPWLEGGGCLSALALAGIQVSVIGMGVFFKVYEIAFWAKCDNLNVFLFTQVLNWAVAFVFHHFYQQQHLNVRIQGYSAISKKLSRISSYLFYMLSWWNAITIFILAMSISHNADDLCNWRCEYSAINLTTFFTFAFGILFVCTTVVYIRQVNLFNQMRLLSDVDILDVWKQDLTLATNLNSGPEYEGFTRALERQSNIIEFYQTRNAKIMEWVSTKFKDQFDAKLL